LLTPKVDLIKVWP